MTNNLMGKSSRFFTASFRPKWLSPGAIRFELVFLERRSAPGRVALGREHSGCTSALRDGLTVPGRSGCLQMSWRIENKSYLVKMVGRFVGLEWIHLIQGFMGEMAVRLGVWFQFLCWEVGFWDQAFFVDMDSWVIWWCLECLLNGDMLVFCA